MGPSDPLEASFCEAGSLCSSLEVYRFLSLYLTPCVCHTGSLWKRSQIDLLLIFSRVDEGCCRAQCLCVGAP